MEEEVIDRAEELRLAIIIYRTLTDEQKLGVHHVLLKLGMQDCGIAAGNERVRPRQGDAIFLDGPGGSGSWMRVSCINSVSALGKSYTYRCIYHALRAYGFNVVVMASTGAAATLLPTGSTVHQAAGLPVPLYSGCDANPRGRRLRRFAQADVFIWVEVRKLSVPVT